MKGVSVVTDEDSDEEPVVVARKKVGDFRASSSLSS